MIKLRLYVTGRTPTAEAIIAKIRESMATHGDYTLEVLDMFAEPERAIDDSVLATPTLLKVLPLPVRQLVGDLRDRERILAGLEIDGEI